MAGRDSGQKVAVFESATPDLSIAEQTTRDSCCEMKMKETTDPSNHVLNLLQYIRPMVRDFTYRSLHLAVYSYGRNVVVEKGIIGSLPGAMVVVKKYVAGCSLYCLLDAILISLREKQDAMNAAVAGCCTGLFLIPGHKSGFFHLSGCALGGAYGLLSFHIHPLRGQVKSANNDVKKQPLPGNQHSWKDIVVNDFVQTACFGTLAKYVFEFYGFKHFTYELIPSFVRASSMTRLSAIAGGALAFSALVWKDLRGEKDYMRNFLYGCVSSFFCSKCYAVPNGLLTGCIGFGVLMASSIGMLTYPPILPQIPPGKNLVCSTGQVLQPFTLSLPKEIEDGFYAFYKSLNKKTDDHA